MEGGVHLVSVSEHLLLQKGFPGGSFGTVD
jgi:hypothetical protein